MPFPYTFPFFFDAEPPFPFQKILLGHPSLGNTYYFIKAGSFILNMPATSVWKRTITAELDHQSQGILEKNWEFIVSTTSPDEYESLMAHLALNDQALLVDVFKTSYAVRIEPMGLITTRYDDAERRDVVMRATWV